MADSKDTTITINPAQDSELVFDVSMTGIDDIHVPNVRFVAISKANKCDYSFPCKRVEGGKHAWQAMIPVLAHIKETSMAFRVEVIIDGYFFQPARGTLVLIQAPVVNMKPKSTVAKVTAKEVTEESNEPILNLDLLTQDTEEDVNFTVDQAIKDVLSEMKNTPLIKSTKSSKRYTEPTLVTEDDEMDSDDVNEPRKLIKPLRPASLFRRISSIRESKQVTDTPETVAAKEVKAARVREILGE